MVNLTSGNVTKSIFSFTWPMLIGNVFQQLYNIVDAIIVGKYVGKEALSGVLASSQVVMVVIALIMGVGIGGTVVIAQYYGARNYKRVQEASETINIFLLVASIILGILGMLFCNQILKIIQLPPEAFSHARSYLMIYFAGLFTVFGYNATSSNLRGIGDSKTPLYALIVSTILNIGLDFLFILKFEMGAGGASLATVIAQLASWIFVIIYVNKKTTVLKFKLFRSRFNFNIFKQCIRIGLPSGIQQTFAAVGMAALFGIVNSFGVDVSAGYGAAMRIDSFAALPAMNFSAALSTFVGQNIGAGFMNRVKKGLSSTLLMSGSISILVSVAVMIFRQPLIGLFTDAVNTEVITVGSQYLTIVCSFYIVFSTMFVFNGLHRGAGAALAPMVFSLISLWLARIPLAWILSRTELGYVGIFWAIPIAWGIGLTLTITYYFSGKWKNKSVLAISKRKDVSNSITEIDPL